MASGVTIRGGYAGCGASNPGARDTVLYETILSGDLSGDDLTVATIKINRSDNSYHVVIYNDPSATGSMLEGFTVSGGHADGTGPAGTATNQGPGIHIRLDSQMCIPGGPTIRDCIIEDNWSSHHGAVNIHADQALIENCIIRNNYSDFRGGGLLIQSGNATVRNCVISNNESLIEGGGVWTGHSSDPTCVPTSAAVFENCTIQDNYSGRLGGGMFDQGSNVIIRGSNFNGNSANSSGGGLWLQTAGQLPSAVQTTPLVEDTLFEANQAQGGAGVGLTHREPTFKRCIFRANTATGVGGGIWIFGPTSDVLLEDCVWELNTAESGGGLGQNSTASKVRISSGTFRDNQATQAGGGIWTYTGSLNVVGTTFERNSGTTVGGGAFVFQDFLNNKCIGDECVTVFEDCVIRDNEAGRGAGVFAGSLIRLIMRRVVIEDNRVVNAIPNGNLARGGGMSFEAFPAVSMETEPGSMRLEDCVIRNNYAPDGGGGLFVSGDICANYAPGLSTATLIRTELVGNTSEVKGAGLYIAGANGACVNMYNSRFIQNRLSALPTYSYGAALYVSGSEILVANSLFAGNYAGSSGAAIYTRAATTGVIENSTFAHNTTDNRAPVLHAEASDISVVNSIVWDNSSLGGGPVIVDELGTLMAVSTSLVQDGYVGVGNFDANPLFFNAAGVDGVLGTEDDDLRLSSGSPARDAANLSLLPTDEFDIDGDGDVTEPIPFDLDGAARIVGMGLDLGAYEQAAAGPCQPGTFSATGEDPCDPCPMGTFQPAAGATSCMDCVVGTFADTIASTLCSPCAAETFQPNTGGTVCNACACDDGMACTTNDCDAISGSCQNDAIVGCAIPTASTWSLICLALLLMSAATILMPRTSTDPFKSM